MENLIERFRAEATERGGLTLFEPRVAIELISAAERAGHLVIGIDGFFVGSNFTQPSLENSINFSDAFQRGENPNARAAEFIRDREDSGLLFELVFDFGLFPDASDT